MADKKRLCIYKSYSFTFALEIVKRCEAVHALLTLFDKEGGTQIIALNVITGAT
jgi:hypothetical protein